MEFGEPVIGDLEGSTREASEEAEVGDWNS